MTNQFALSLEALTELAPEIQAAHADPQPALPQLSEVLAEFSALPREALFLGLASDGLPVLLNLNDAVPGPLLLIGDAGSGKTNLLHVITRAVQKMHNQQDVKYGIITSHPQEWQSFDDPGHCVGIHDINDKSAQGFLESLSKWTHSNKGQGGFILMLIDDLEAISNVKEAQQNLSWLFLRGTARHVWPIVTLNTTRAIHVNPWLGFFRTRLFGHMDDSLEARALTGSDAKMEELITGVQFAMREGNKWLKFWLPSLGLDKETTVVE
jgi:hypothetical protein